MENSSVLLKLSRQPLSLWSSSFVQESGSVSQVCCIRFSRTVGQKLSPYSMYEGGFGANASFARSVLILGQRPKNDFFCKTAISVDYFAIYQSYFIFSLQFLVYLSTLLSLSNLSFYLISLPSFPFMYLSILPPSYPFSAVFLVSWSEIKIPARETQRFVAELRNPARYLDGNEIFPARSLLIERYRAEIFL